MAWSLVGYLKEVDPSDNEWAHSYLTAPPRLRKAALASVKDGKESASLENQTFFHLNGSSMRLRVGLITKGVDGTARSGSTEVPRRNTVAGGSPDRHTGIDAELVWAQAASVEDELYHEVRLHTSALRGSRMNY